VVPAGGHRQAGDSGEEIAGGAEDADLEEKNDDAGDEVAEGAGAEGQAEGLGDGGDVVDGDAGELMAMYSRPAAAKRVWPMRARELGSVWGRWSSKGVKWIGTW
jgi:hypothetical protein